jgi:hypothetical protein
MKYPEGEFSVWAFFADGFHFRHIEWVEEITALEGAGEVISSVAAQVGVIERVIITDGGDNTVFEWEFGLGITFPTPEQRKEAKENGNSSD